MSNFMILLKKNLIEMARNKRVVIFPVIFIAIAIISAVSAKYIPVILEMLLETVNEPGLEQLLIMKPTVADSYVQFISNFSQVSVLVVGIMFANTITKEKKKGTYANLKMNGVSDNDIVLSHFLSQIILITFSFLLSVAVFVVLNIVLFNQVMGLRGLVANLYIYLMLLATICFSLFCSCLFNKKGAGYLTVILTYFGLTFIEVMPKINRVSPFHLTTLGNNLMYYSYYSISNHLFTVSSCLIICALLVIFSLYVVKNKINNKKVMINDNTKGI